MTFTHEQIDVAADALRHHEQGGKKLNFWSTLPNGTKQRWRDKVFTVIRGLGAAKEENRSQS